jgi:hypothetical protein
MRRNGHIGESESRSGSGWLAGLFSLVGGIGIGAGLLYLLDPDKGKRRRQQILGSATDLASHARDYAGDAIGSVGSKIGTALGSARDFAGEKLHDVGDFASRRVRGAQDYAHDRADDVRAYAQKQVFGETRAEHRMGVTLCALSSMALGAALMYAFDPATGKNRRRIAREKASEFASSASGYAQQAGEAIKSGVSQMREKVGGMKSAADRNEQTTASTGM